MSQSGKLLITGSNGLLGQKLVKALAAGDEFDVIATSTESDRITGTKNYVYEVMDITDKHRVDEVMERYRPDVLINTAAMTNVDACETEKEKCRKINVEGVENLVEACKKYDTHFIHLSTDFVFDGKNGPYKEDDEPAPLSYYAQSKVDSEKIVQQSGLRWAIIRTIIIYGIADSMSRSNVVLWAREALGKGQKVNIVDDQYRMPTLAEDLAQGCILAAIKGATGIYHISGKDMMSILELVETVADYFGLDKSLITPVSSTSLNQVAKRPQKTGFVLDKAINELGYRPHSFREGLGILADQLKQRGVPN